MATLHCRRCEALFAMLSGSTQEKTAENAHAMWNVFVFHVVGCPKALQYLSEIASEATPKRHTGKVFPPPVGWRDRQYAIGI